MAIKTSETATVVKPCLDWLQLYGIMAWRNNTGAMEGEHKGKRWYVKFGRPGISDIAGILPDGRALYIECKLPGKEPTDDQQAFLDEVNATNAVGLVVHSLEELVRKLRAAR